MRGDAGDVYRSGGDVDKEQDVMRDEPSDRADFDAQEVRRCQTFPVGLQKRRPSGVPVSLGCRLNAVLFEDVGDGAASNLMSQIGQRASDSRVPPGGIFKRHLKNEIDDRLHDARSTWAAPLAVVPLGRHQFPVPSQQRVRRDQGFKLIQHLAPECLRFSGESTAFDIGETKAPPTHALLKHAVLFLEILNHVQLMAVYPTGEHQEEHLNRPKQWGHCSRVYRSLRHPALFRSLAARQMASSDYLDNTGIAAALRSDATPPFGQAIGNLFGQSNPDQRAGVLNEILRTLGPAGLASAGGGIFGRILGTGAAGPTTSITPTQAAQVSPADLSTIASNAQQQDDSVVDRLGSFYAQHPTLVKTLGVAALGAVMSHMSRQRAA